MTDVLFELFDDLNKELRRVENKHTVGDDSDDAIPEYEIVAGRDMAEKTKGNDQTGDESGKIADLNDRFRQNPSADDGEIKGEWIMGDDVIALSAPTKASIIKKIGEYADFVDCPLHDHGVIHHTTKGKTLRVVWMIRVYEAPSLQTESEAPGDPSRSYRAMLITLSEEEEAKS